MKMRLRDKLVVLALSLAMIVTFVPLQGEQAYAEENSGVISVDDMNDMIWESYSGPHVVTAGSKVFWGYVTSSKSVGVACYDKNTGTLTKKALDTVKTSSSNPWGDHDAITVSLTADNHIVCIYAPDASTNKTIHFRISDDPLSIDSFSKDTAVKGANFANHMQFVDSGGKYYIFFRITQKGVWDFIKSEDNGTTWTPVSSAGDYGRKIINETGMVYYCKFVPTSDPDLIRVLMCSDPSGTDPDIRMGFFNTTNDTLYNADGVSILGTKEIQRTAFEVIQATESGKKHQLLDVAVTAPDKPRFIFADFTNTAGANDSVYKLHDSGNVYNVCAGGSALLDPTMPLGAAFKGIDEIIAIRNAEGNDIIESYAFDGTGVSKEKTLYTHAVTGNSRAARPIVDAKGSAVLWLEGTYTGPQAFNTAGRLLVIVPKNIELNETEFIYNGQVQRPTVSIGLLKEGTDYDLTWSNQDSAEIGTYTVTATFKGDYSGVPDKTATYSIVPDPYQLELVAPYEGTPWTVNEVTYNTEGGFCKNTRVTFKATAPAGSGAWVGVYQAYENNINGNNGFAWDRVLATSLTDDNALIDLANPANGGALNDAGYLNGGCYKAILYNDSGYTPKKTIYFYIYGGHKFKAATYEWADDNSTVTAKRVCSGCSQFETETKNTVEATKPATCIEAGEKTLTATFENTAFEAQTKVVEVLPINEDAHDWADPTYAWSDDNSKVTATRVCNYNNEHKQTEDAATTHETTKAATCTKTGTEHYKSAAFNNSAFAVQEKDVEIAIDPDAHDWADPTYVWSDDNSKVTATRVCNHNDAHKQTEDAATTHTTTKAATCTETGTEHFTSATFENSAFAVQEKDVEIPMLEHAWDNGTVTTPATCMEEGEMTYKCTAAACNATKTEPIAIDKVNGHKWNDGVVTTEPKCNNAGVKTFTCELCKETYTEAIDKTGHTPGEMVIENEVAATCTTNGSYDEVIYCTVCNAVISRETKAVPSPGHAMQHTPAAAATCTEVGNSEYWYCPACGKFFADEGGAQILAQDAWILPATGHKWDAGKITTAPTATKKGVKTFTCTVCGATKTTSLPTRNNQVATDGTKVGPGASEEVAGKAITGMKTDSDPAGSAFKLLRAKSTKQGQTYVTVSWAKVKGAKKYVIYGNACGKTNKMKKLATVKGNYCTFKRVITNKGKKVKVKKGTYYKFIVVALNGSRNVVSTSKVIHVATTGGKVGNDKYVTTKAKKNAVTVKVGKTFYLGAKAVPASKKKAVKRHRGLKYETTNKAIATVSAKGTITGKKKGSCSVYVYAQNGICKRISVTVK